MIVEERIRGVIQRLYDRVGGDTDAYEDVHEEIMAILNGRSVEPTTRWRVGRKVGRTLYRDDVLVGLVDTPELAEAIVQAMNDAEARSVEP